MGKIEDINAESADLSFSVELRCTHPSMAARLISDMVGHEGERMWSSGEKITTPAGRQLDGKYPNSLWASSVKITGRRDFFAAALEFFDSFSVDYDKLISFVRDEGKIYLIVGLSGERNIGDELDLQIAADLAKMNIIVGIEVFPGKKK